MGNVWTLLKSIVFSSFHTLTRQEQGGGGGGGGGGEEANDQQWLRHYYQPHPLSSFLGRPLDTTYACCTTSVHIQTTSLASSPSLRRQKRVHTCAVCPSSELLSLQMWEITKNNTVRNYVLSSSFKDNGDNMPLVALEHETKCGYYDKLNNKTTDALVHPGCWIGILCNSCVEKLRRISPLLEDNLALYTTPVRDQFQNDAVCGICYEPCSVFVGCCLARMCITCTFQSRHFQKCPFCNHVDEFLSWRNSTIFETTTSIGDVVQKVWFHPSFDSHV